jgi:hypothetical protein
VSTALKDENGKITVTTVYSDGTELTSETDMDTINSQNQMAEQVLKSADLKVTIEVPEVIKSNATNTEGNKLTWDLTQFKEKTIELEFAIPKGGGFPLIPVAIGGGIALVVIVVVVLLLSKKKKGPKDAAPAPVVEGAAPVVPTVQDTVPPVVESSVEAPAPVVEPVASVEPAPAVEPVVEAPAPVVEAPVVEAPAPVVETFTPAEPAPAPVVETPVVEAPAPVVEAPTPVEPVVETPTVTPTPEVPTNTENNGQM